MSAGYRWILTTDKKRSDDSVAPAPPRVPKTPLKISNASGELPKIASDGDYSTVTPKVLA
jgi:hypothetical protein